MYQKWCVILPYYVCTSVFISVFTSVLIIVSKSLTVKNGILKVCWPFGDNLSQNQATAMDVALLLMFEVLDSHSYSSPLYSLSSYPLLTLKQKQTCVLDAHKGALLLYCWTSLTGKSTSFVLTPFFLEMSHIAFFFASVNAGDDFFDTDQQVQWIKHKD